MSINGYLQFVSVRSQKVLDALRKQVEVTGEWNEAVTAARRHRAELGAGRTPSVMGSDTEFTPNMTPAEHANGQPTTSYTDPTTANALRKRLAAVSAESNYRMSTPNMELSEYPASGASSMPTTPPPSNLAPSPHPLVDHPDDAISTLAREYSELEGELTSSGPNYVRWPNNISLRDFTIYQLIPTLVYELEYPRTEKSVLMFKHRQLSTDPISLFLEYDHYTFLKRQ